MTYHLTASVDLSPAPQGLQPPRSPHQTDGLDFLKQPTCSQASKQFPTLFSQWGVFSSLIFSTHLLICVASPKATGAPGLGSADLTVAWVGWALGGQGDTSLFCLQDLAWQVRLPT